MGVGPSVPGDIAGCQAHIAVNSKMSPPAFVPGQLIEGYAQATGARDGASELGSHSDCTADLGPSRGARGAERVH